MPREVKRPVRIEGDVAYIPLTRGYEAIIDVEDVPLVEGFNWRAIVKPTTVYAQRNVPSKSEPAAVFLHRLIMGAPEAVPVDHIDGNGLNNRRRGDACNLRTVIHAQNMANRRQPKHNTSGLKGVTWHKRLGKWQAQIQANGKNHYLGLHATLEAANDAYADASNRLHGEFRRKP